MVLHAPRQPPSPDRDVDAGVIDDARARQRKQRWIGAAVIAALVVAGLIIGFSGGGGGPGGNGAGPGEGGAPLPSESSLMQEYGISRDSVRKAMDVLRAEGLVITVQGKGSFAAEDG